MFIKPKERTQDSYGTGAYGAPRRRNGESYSHSGVDLCCEPNSDIISCVNGRVTKLGYPYANHLEFRYVEITDDRNFRHRFFYVHPLVEFGQSVKIGDLIGVSQKLGDLYPVTKRKPIPIQEHVHYEVMKMENGKKKFFDPNLFSGE